MFGKACWTGKGFGGCLTNALGLCFLPGNGLANLYSDRLLRVLVPHALVGWRRIQIVDRWVRQGQTDDPEAEAFIAACARSKTSSTRCSLQLSDGLSRAGTLYSTSIGVAPPSGLIIGASTGLAAARLHM